MKFYPFITILLILIATSCFSQNRKLTKSEIKNSTADKIYSIDSENCKGIIESFKCDLNNDNLFLFITGTIVNLSHINDESIENKYGIYFYVYGCVTPNIKCLTEYNKMVFDHLVKNYDDKWISHIRTDLYGFKEWK